MKRHISGGEDDVTVGNRVIDYRPTPYVCKPGTGLNETTARAEWKKSKDRQRTSGRRVWSCLAELLKERERRRTRHEPNKTLHSLDHE